MLHFAFLALLIKLEIFYLCSAYLCSAFRELRDDEDFVDVTLACDDERTQAHKVILSACGLFFIPSEWAWYDGEDDAQDRRTG